MRGLQPQPLHPSPETSKGGAAAPSDDPLSFRPNPDALVSKLGDDAPGGGGTALYRPPRLNPVSMDDPDKESRLAKDRRRQKATLRKAQGNQFVRDLEAELTGAPDELRERGAGGDTLEGLRERQRQDARASAEEDLMVSGWKGGGWRQRSGTGGRWRRRTSWGEALSSGHVRRATSTSAPLTPTF